MTPLTHRALDHFAVGVHSSWTRHRQSTFSLKNEQRMKLRLNGSLGHSFAPPEYWLVMDLRRPYTGQCLHNADIPSEVRSSNRRSSSNVVLHIGSRNSLRGSRLSYRKCRIADDVENLSRKIAQKSVNARSILRNSYRSGGDDDDRGPRHRKEKLSEDSSNTSMRGKPNYRKYGSSEGKANPKEWSSNERKGTLSNHSKDENERIQEGKINGTSSDSAEDKLEMSSKTGTRGNVPKRRTKEPKTNPQVQFSSAMSKDPHIAIVGGGMSGLMCAVTLEKQGIRSTVFDTGKHGLGGRLATRHVCMHGGMPLVFDHAAQFFTVSDPRFKCFVERWISEGIVKEWHGVIGKLRLGHFIKHPECAKYIAVHGMRSLADYIASQGKLITVKRPCWISNMYACGDSWHLMENGQSQGFYDAIVIAHNGKCANNLLAPAGVPLIAKQMKRLELSSIWALLAAFEERLPLPKHIEGALQLDGAFVEGVDSISWIANNTTKLSPMFEESPHCWTFFSTATYGQRNKVPQESIPNARAIRVTTEMLHGVELALGLEKGSLPTPLYSRVQLWGAALPTNSPSEPCIFDPYGRVGICGDWLLGSSVEAAALSGMAIANHISSFRDSGEVSDSRFEIGLHNNFTSIAGHDIGQFSDSSEQCGLKLEAPLAV